MSVETLFAHERVHIEGTVMSVVDTEGAFSSKFGGQSTIFYEKTLSFGLIQFIVLYVLELSQNEAVLPSCCPLLMKTLCLLVYDVKTALTNVQYRGNYFKLKRSKRSIFKEMSESMRSYLNILERIKTN